MKFIFRGIGGFFTLVFALGAPFYPPALASSVVQGSVVSVVPCTNPAGYVIGVGSPALKYIFKTGSTTVMPAETVPAPGQAVFLAIEAPATCDTASGQAVSTISGGSVVYFSLTNSSSSPASTPTSSPLSPSSSSSSGGGLPSQVTSILQSFLQSPSGSSGSAAGSAGASANVSPFNFGGMITAVVQCDPTSSLPSGTISLVTIEGAKPGLFTYGAYSKSYLNGPANVPGKNTVGSYTPGAKCDIDLDPHTPPVYAANVLGWMNAAPGHGTSGEASSFTSTGTGPQSPLPPASTSCQGFNMTPLQSCIAANESSCNPNVGSGTDVGADGNPVSWGLGQINISANKVQCSGVNGGQPLNCPSAFSGGAYTANNHNTRVVNQSLYRECIAAVQNTQCNIEMMNRLYAQQGLNAWGSAARNNCSTLQ